MIHNVQMLCLFLVVIVVIYSSYSYAPASPLWNEPSHNVPSQTVTGTCPGWMKFEKLTENSVDGEESNMVRAMARDKSFDQGKHVWAACYAYFISTFPESPQIYWSIFGFCNKVNPEHKSTPFLSLQNAKMTCAEWLNAYGYVDNVEDNIVNAQLALNRVRENDKDPHFLVAMFPIYIENRLKEKEILQLKEYEYTPVPDDFSALASPSEFCQLLENTVVNRSAKKIPFATLDTKKFCHEWIVLSGYSTIDNDYNVRKALRQLKQFLNYHSKWTREYINYLCNFDSRDTSQTPTPEEFCNNKGYLDPVYYDRADVNVMIVINQ